jgi:hypothetical protein
MVNKLSLALSLLFLSLGLGHGTATRPTLLEIIFIALPSSPRGGGGATGQKQRRLPRRRLREQARMSEQSIPRSIEPDKTEGEMKRWHIHRANNTCKQHERLRAHRGDAQREAGDPECE